MRDLKIEELEHVYGAGGKGRRRGKGGKKGRGGSVSRSAPSVSRGKSRDKTRSVSRS
jgi:hypothetical protein